ncbi:MAG: M14 family zinc carboxypeptidase [Flavisolibacter sp.]
MRRIFFILPALVCFLSPYAQYDQIPHKFPFTKFEYTGGKETVTYQEAIAWWKKLDSASPMVKMLEMGPTDAGYPLNLILVSADKDFKIQSIKKKKKTIILINNGIHPGEPDGIDATMLLIRDLVSPYNISPLPNTNGPVWVRENLPDNIVLAIIPVYNIGGTLNRSADYRVDQNGPEEFGFRGNSQNLDLNRDFIKCDSKEAFTFAKIFHYLDPDIQIDNHVSNGADYQHVLTLLSTQHNKLGGAAGKFLNETMEPALYAAMKNLGWDLIPYVNHFGDTPEKGWSEFWDSPRYSSGYAALWTTFSFMPETHMLKPYKQRVEATRDLMKCFIGFASEHSTEINRIRKETKQKEQTQMSFPIAWKWDRTKSKLISYKGFEATHKPSDISGLQRLYYDRSKPFEKQIPFYNVYTDTFSVQKPKAYIIPQGWWKVIERLQANQVQMKKLAKDSSIEVEWYRIESYQSGTRPFEGHHLNGNVQVSTHKQKVNFRKGDYYIPLNQVANRFIIETLEPQAEDSYFTWNFFDAILGQKEGYSDYHFEDVAAEYLKNNPELKAKLDQRKSTDSSFAKSAGAQLNFIYQNSPWIEPAYLQYPVFRVSSDK